MVMLMNSIVPLIQTVIVAASLRLAGEMPLADRLSPLEIESVTVPHERVALPVETQLFMPTGPAAETIEPRSETRYGSVCYAYLKENGLFIRRFAVHNPDREGLPVARNAARFMAL